MHIVYVATNRENGHRYVGATKNSLEFRRKRHFYDARRDGFCRVFYAAIRKYGEEAFDWSILKECASLEDAMAEEIRHIELLQPEYNITSGGRGLRGIPRTREWIEKAAASNRGKKRSPESIQKVKDARPLDMNFKSVLCLNDGLLFRSVKMAALHYGLGEERVSVVCHGREITAGGHHFVFADAVMSEVARASFIVEREFRRQKAKDNLRASRRKSVVCLNDGRVFESGAAAARFFGLSVMRVSQMCRNGSATKTGLRFSFRVEISEAA